MSRGLPRHPVVAARPRGGTRRMSDCHLETGTIPVRIQEGRGNRVTVQRTKTTQTREVATAPLGEASLLS